MTKKALNFVVNGMLSNEPEIARERIAYMLSMASDAVIDGFTDGFVLGTRIYDLEAFNTFVEKQNENKEIILFEGTNFENSTAGESYLRVRIVYAIYRKKDGKDYDYKLKMEGDYCVPGERKDVISIPVNANSIIPGVELHIL